MASENTFTESDEGKKVIDPEGATLGRILEVADGRAYVTPDEEYPQSALLAPHDVNRDDGTFAVESDRIAKIAPDEIILESP